MATEQKANKPRYWFHAKRYGWGGGLPCSWEGWAVLVGFCALAAADVHFLPRGIVQMGVLGLLAILLVVIYQAKGEPWRWRWGNRDDDSRPT